MRFSSFDESKSLEDKLNEIEEETFRNPNLLIQTIKEMQQKQEESLKDIQLKLSERFEGNIIFHTEFIFIQSQRDFLVWFN